MENALRKIAIFIISLPLLALAIVWIPMGIAFDIVMSPIWGSLAVIALLRGEDPMWDIFLGPPLMMLSIYSETTGLIPDPLERF